VRNLNSMHESLSYFHVNILYISVQEPQWTGDRLMHNGLSQNAKEMELAAKNCIKTWS